jgi:hypothetical protein
LTSEFVRRVEQEGDLCTAERPGPDRHLVDDAVEVLAAGPQRVIEMLAVVPLVMKAPGPEPFMFESASETLREMAFRGAERDRTRPPECDSDHLRKKSITYDHETLPQTEKRQQFSPVPAVTIEESLARTRLPQYWPAGVFRLVGSSLGRLDLFGHWRARRSRCRPSGSDG